MSIKKRNVKALALLACFYLGAASAFALDPTTDFMQNGSTGTCPVKTGNTTTFAQDSNIDTYRWNKFNLSQDEIAKFNFTNPNSAAINYLTPGADPSSIAGKIEGSNNGNVFLFNPNGITFGAGASVSDLRSFTASTNTFHSVDQKGILTFTEAAENKKLVVSDITLNNVTQVQFVAPSVAIEKIKYEGDTKPQTFNIIAAGSGQVPLNGGTPKLLAAKGKLPDGAVIDIGADLEAQYINIMAFVNSNKVENVSLRGNITAPKIVEDNGTIYILTNNENTDPACKVKVTQTGNINISDGHLSLTVQDYDQNGEMNIDFEVGSYGPSVIQADNYNQNGEINLKNTEITIAAKNYVQNGIINIEAIKDSRSGLIIFADNLKLNKDILFQGQGESTLKLAGIEKFEIDENIKISASEINIGSKNISIGKNDAKSSLNISNDYMNKLLENNHNIALSGFNDINIVGNIIGEKSNLILNAQRTININGDISVNDLQIFANYNQRGIRLDKSDRKVSLPQKQPQENDIEKYREAGAGTIVFDKSSKITAAKGILLNVMESKGKFVAGALDLNNTLKSETFAVGAYGQMDKALTINGSITTTGEKDEYGNWLGTTFEVNEDSNASIEFNTGSLSTKRFNTNTTRISINNDFNISQPIKYFGYTSDNNKILDMVSFSPLFEKLSPVFFNFENYRRGTEIITSKPMDFSNIKMSFSGCKKIQLESSGSLSIGDIYAENANLKAANQLSIDTGSFDNYFNIEAGGDIAIAKLDMTNGDNNTATGIIKTQGTLSFAQIDFKHSLDITANNISKLATTENNYRIYGNKDYLSPLSILNLNLKGQDISISDAWGAAKLFDGIDECLICNLSDLNLNLENNICTNIQANNWDINKFKLTAKDINVNKLILQSYEDSDSRVVDLSASGNLNLSGDISANSEIKLSFNEFHNTMDNPETNTPMLTSKAYSIATKGQNIAIMGASQNFSDTLLFGTTEGMSGNDRLIFTNPQNAAYNLELYCPDKTITLTHLSVLKNIGTLKIESNIFNSNYKVSISGYNDSTSSVSIKANNMNYFASRDWSLNIEYLNSLLIDCDNMTFTNEQSSDKTNLYRIGAIDLRIKNSDMAITNPPAIKIDSSNAFNIGFSTSALSLSVGDGKSITIGANMNYQSLSLTAPRIINKGDSKYITSDKIYLSTNDLSFFNNIKGAQDVSFKRYDGQSLSNTEIYDVITKFTPTALSLEFGSNQSDLSLTDAGREDINFSNILFNLKSNTTAKIELTSKGSLDLGNINGKSICLTANVGDITLNRDVDCSSLIASNGKIQSVGYPINIIVDKEISASGDITLDADNIQLSGVSADNVDLTAKNNLEIKDFKKATIASLISNGTLSFNISGKTEIGDLSLNTSNLNLTIADNADAEISSLTVSGENLNFNINTNSPEKIKITTMEIKSSNYLNFVNPQNKKLDIENIKLSSYIYDYRDIDNLFLNSIFCNINIKNLTFDKSISINIYDPFDFSNAKLTINSEYGGTITSLKDLHIQGISTNQLELTSTLGSIIFEDGAKISGGLYFTTLSDNGKINTIDKADFSNSRLSLTSNNVNISSSGDLNIEMSTVKKLTCNADLNLSLKNIEADSITAIAKNNIVAGSITAEKVLLTSNQGDVNIDNTNININKLTINAENGLVSVIKGGLVLGIKAPAAARQFDQGFFVKELNIKAKDVDIEAPECLNIASLNASGNATLTSLECVNILGKIDVGNILMLGSSRIISASKDLLGADYSINAPTIKLAADVLAFANAKNTTPSSITIMASNNVNPITDVNLKNVTSAFNASAYYFGNPGECFSDIISKSNIKVDFGSAKLSLSTAGNIVLNSSSDLNIFGPIQSKNLALNSDKNIDLVNMGNYFSNDCNLKLNAKGSLTLAQDIIVKNADINANEIIKADPPLKSGPTTADVPQKLEITGSESTKIALNSGDIRLTKTQDGSLLSFSKTPSASTLDKADDSNLTIKVGKTANLKADAGDNYDIIFEEDYVNTDLKALTLGGKNIKTAAEDTKVSILDELGAKIALIWRGKAAPHVTNDQSRWSSDFQKGAVLIADDFGTANTSLDISTTNADLLYADDINYSPNPTPDQRISLSTQNPYYVYNENSPRPEPIPDPTTTGGGSNATGAIVGGTVGGTAAAGAAAIGVSQMGLLPGLLLGLASPIQYDETMLDFFIDNKCQYPLLMRNLDYVFQVTDPSTLDPTKIGSVKFIPDSCIADGSYDVLKIRIPEKLACCKKPITIKITEKSCPFKVTKNTPDLNFNIFNSIDGKKISSLYQSRRFMKKSIIDKYAVKETYRLVKENEGIVQKTITVCPQDLCKEISVIVNYAKDGHIPKKGCKNLPKQNYSLIIQFCENK